MTVTGRTSPLLSNSWVIPTFLPKIPLTDISFPSPSSLAFSGLCELSGVGLPFGYFRLPTFDLLLFFTVSLDLNVNASRKIELHERVHRLLRRLEDVEQALVRADLELLTRLLVDVRRTENAIFVLHRRQRDRPRHLRSGPASGIDDLPGRLVEHAV